MEIEKTEGDEALKRMKMSERKVGEEIEEGDNSIRVAADRDISDRSVTFVLERNSEFGQFLKATRDIKAGSLVLEDCPAFFGPTADYVEDYSTPICLGCSVVMNDGNEEFRCSICKWPLCGPQCDKADYHEAYECEVLAKEKVPFPPSSDLLMQNCYKGITILRGLLLKEKNPKLWEKVMNLQWVNEIQNSPEPDLTEFKKDFGLPGFGDNEDWTRILGVLNVNSYSIQRVEKKAGSPSFAEFIYPIQCLMNHSCVPNCNWAITYSPEFIIKARAAVDIKKGDMLSVTYNYDMSKYGCHKRQERIRAQAKFSCRCIRCLDPTDLGTFAAAVICFKCKNGLMLPMHSQDPESDWKCNECVYTMCQSFISSFVESLHEQVEMAEAEAEDTEESVVEIWEDFFVTKSGSVLHPNHWVLTVTSQAIINHQSSKLSELNKEDLDRFLWHCEHILEILDTVAPGISTEKGILQHHIARAKYKRVELDIQQKILTDEAEIETEMRKVYSIQKCALLFWKENPHYGTLHANYKRDAELLMDEMHRLKSKYSLE